jgi:hypothetical protein
MALGKVPTQAPLAGQLVLVRVRQPSLVVPQVKTWLPTQRLPSMPAGQSVLVGSFTQMQSAGDPPHCLLPVQLLATDEVEQPSLFVPQERTVEVPWQTVPLLTPAHSAAAGAHRQSATPPCTPQGFPAGQAFTCAEVGQPSPLVPQDRTSFPLQTVPLAPLPHSGATAPQRQSAMPPITAQGLPAGQLFTGDEVTQPFAVVLQASTLLFEQTVPLPVPAQAAGGALHWQPALPALPWQVSLGPQVFMAVTAGQPSLFEAQVMRVVPLVQRLPLVPMQAAGGAPHEQEAEGRLPVQGLPDGQVVAGPL